MSPAAEPVARRVAYNTAVQAAGKGVVLLIGVASVAVVTRYLGAEGYGKFALALAFVQMLGVLADVGLLTIVVREISKAPERTRELVGNAMTIRLALSFAVIALAGLVSLLLPYDEQVRVAILIAGAPLMLGLLNTSLVAVMQARLQMDRAVVSDIAGRAAAFAAVIAVAALDLGFYAVVVTAGVGALVTLCVTYVLSRPLVRVRFSGDRVVWRELLVAALPLGLALAINEIYFRADTLILSLYRSYEEVGVYSLAFRVLELLAVFPAVFMNSVFPLMSRYLAQSAERARRTLDVAADVLVAVGLPLAAGGLVVAPHVVRLIGGGDFEDAADPLRLLLLAGALAFVSGLFGYTLIAAGRQRAALWLNVFALAFNVALNLALVPSLGVDAAAATAVASEIVLLAGGYVLVRRHVGLSPRFGLLPKALAAAVVMGAVLWLLRDWSLALLLPLGIAIYGGLLYALGGVDRRALAELRA